MKQSVSMAVVNSQVNQKIKREKIMNRDQIKGVAKDIKGDIKKGIGEATGNKALVDEGNLDKAEGKIQKGAGNLKDKI
jgi:uncharacterized protein YjbJ (UPF0337 family)